MNPNYSHTITLYNRIPAQASGAAYDSWQRTVLTNCFFSCTATLVQSGTGAEQENTYSVRIPESDAYQEAAAWDVNASRGDMWTVHEDDVVVFGECSSEITSQYTVYDLMDDHKPDAFRVQSFSDNTRYPWEKHYHLTGGSYRR